MERSAMEGTGTNGDASFKHHVSGLVDEVETLVRQELRLAQCELAEKAREARAGFLKVGLAAVAALGGALSVLAACILGLSALLARAMSPFAAALASAALVGAGLLGGAYLLFRWGGSEIRLGRLVPEKTLDSLKENARWARHQL